jgi:Protein of unknown function (DUF3237)
MTEVNRRAMLAATPAALLANSTPLIMTNVPTLRLVFTARIEVAAPVEQGIVDGIRRRFIAITGGDVSGPRLSGIVLSGGGDWQSIHPDGLTDLFARYSIKADDGTIIAITNPGIRVASPEIIARLAAGEDVNPSLYYFRTTPRFEVATGGHDWLRRQIFVGHGIRKPNEVILECYALD